VDKIASGYDPGDQEATIEIYAALGLSKVFAGFFDDEPGIYPFQLTRDMLEESIKRNTLQVEYDVGFWRNIALNRTYSVANKKLLALSIYRQIDADTWNKTFTCPSLQPQYVLQHLDLFRQPEKLLNKALRLKGEVRGRDKWAMRATCVHLSTEMWTEPPNAKDIPQLITRCLFSAPLSAMFTQEERVRAEMFYSGDMECVCSTFPQGRMLQRLRKWLVAEPYLEGAVCD